MDYVLISSNDALAETCARARRHPAVALDTEFVRTRTLAPHLGLLQLYDGHQLVLIDPLPITDFTPLIHLLTDDKVVKVLHSCSEDLETFLNAFNVLPTPVFDTQVAASILGLGPTLGYARLIEELCGVTLDKGESRTDWLARPLRDAQLHYAANDVLYLLPAYEQLSQMIDARGKRHWVTEEIATLGERKRASMPLEFAYLQIKNNWRLSSQQLTVLQHLAAWRLNRAREKDMALNFVFKESALFDVAQRLPTNRASLSRISGVTPHVLRLFADTLLKLVEQGLDEFELLPSEQHLPPVRRLIDIPAYKKSMAAIKEITDTLAERQGVTSDVLASKKQMNQVLKWWWFDIDETRVLGLMPDLLSGWRKPLFEQALIGVLGPLPDNTVPNLVNS